MVNGNILGASAARAFVAVALDKRQHEAVAVASKLSAPTCRRVLFGGFCDGASALLDKPSLILGGVFLCLITGKGATQNDIDFLL